MSRLAARDSRVALVTTMTTLMITIDQTFIEYPHMQKYFHEGQEPPEADRLEYERAQAIAMAMANALDLYIAELHTKSPALKKLLEDHKDWWPGLQKQVGNKS